METTLWKLARVWPIAVLLATACENTLTSAEPDVRVDGGGFQPGGAGGAGGGPGGIDAPPTDCVVAEDRLRRLSNEELLNSYGDLFPNQPVPNVPLPVPATPNGFDNDAATLKFEQSDFDAQLEILETFAPSIATEAMERAGCVAADTLEGCADRLVDHWGLRILRRPLSDEQRSAYRTLMVSSGDLNAGAALVLQAMFMSPEFVYRVETPAQATETPGVYTVDSFSIAERLSYLLWSGPPDDALLDAAMMDELQNPETLRFEAERMLQDPKAKRPIDAFFRQWLELDHIDDAIKNDGDALDQELRAAMKEQTARTLEYLVFDQRATVEEFFTSNETFVNAELAELYGMEPVDGWTQVSLDATERRGLLTHAGFLAGHGHPNYPSPVLRGVFILENVLCASPGAPPPDAQDASPDEGSNEEIVTNRDRYEAATTLQGASCATCHQFINPIGYAFETYDTMGRYRTMDNNVPVETAGAYSGESFADAVGFIDAFAGSEQVQSCVAEKYLTFALSGQDVSDSQCLQYQVNEVVNDSGGLMSEMFVALVTQPEFRTLRVSE